MIVFRKQFFIITGCLFVVSVGAEDHRPKLPNIILMMADDMGLGDTSAYLGRKASPHAHRIEKTLRTPQLESFAKESLVFTNAYAPASMCSSTRYSLLTGRFAHRSYLKHQGWLPHGPNSPMIQRELTTLPEMLQRLGYHTAAIGKYHVGMSLSDVDDNVADEFDFSDVDFTKPILDGPIDHGFDEFFGVPGNTEDPLDTEPRIFIRDDRWTFTDRDEMKLIGMGSREGRILAAPDWDLSQIGPEYLREALAYLERRSQAEVPFFLYYVPNANHLQRYPHGDYAVPDQIAGEPVSGESRYTDGSPGRDREDMVLENDIAFGKLLEALRETEDPRWPGHNLIENTLVIFTSDNGPNTGDNNGPSQESAGLRGKKAKIWEGGIRVPLLISLPGRFEGGEPVESIFSLTDLFATLAAMTGYPLMPEEAQDSHDSLAYWDQTTKGPDERPRVFFCHLGPPFSNDTLAMRKGTFKLIADGGLALPSIKGGQLGASLPLACFDLATNPYEEESAIPDEAMALAEELLKIHNRGHARSLDIEPGDSLIVEPGWHNLRNDIDGEIGFQFTVSTEKTVSHLGMWIGADRDEPVREPRTSWSEAGRDRPSSEKRRSLASDHTIRLIDADGKELARVDLAEGLATKPGNPFLYGPLEEPIVLKPDTAYTLLQSTEAFDGDLFRDPASLDGLSPLVDPDFRLVRSVMLRPSETGDYFPIPAFADLHQDYHRYRLPVGPTLKVQTP